LTGIDVFDEVVDVTRGQLYVVATPIGNLEDITLRAIKVLKAVDLVLAEDTRRTRQLLRHFQIHKPVTSYHAYTPESKEQSLLTLLESGKSLAMVSDAGTPGISDPGGRIIQKAIEWRIPVIPIPGPTALTAALTVCGLPLHQFLFAGFLPSKTSARRKHLEGLRWEKATLVFYESPHRLVAMLKDVLQAFGNRRAAVARELTKVHEEVIRGTMVEVVDHFQRTPPRGELVVVVEGCR